MKIILIIDSASNKSITVGLHIGEKIIRLTSRARLLKSQAVLPLIDNILKKNSLDIFEIEGIQIHLGPGSFTGLRVGVAIANALSYGLKIPINGEPIGSIVTPTYEAQTR